MKSRKLLFVPVLLLLLFTLMPGVTALAQKPPPPVATEEVGARAAYISDPWIESDEYGDAYVYFELQVDGMQGREMLVSVWPIYADSSNFMPNANGDPDFSDNDGALVSTVSLSVPYESTLWTGDAPFELYLPADGFPLGNYSWYPLIGVYDVTGEAALLEHGFSEEDFQMSYLTNMASLVEEPAGNGIFINKVHYQYDEEYIYAVFDLELYDIPIGADVQINIYPRFVDTDGFVPSTNYNPDFTDYDGDVVSSAIVSMEFESTVWLESNDNEFIMVIPIANFPEGDYLVYLEYLFFLYDRNGDPFLVYAYDAIDRTIWISG